MNIQLKVVLITFPEQTGFKYGKDFNMNNFICLLGLCTTFCLAGCVSADADNSLRYSVEFKNIGLKKIKVSEIILCASQASSMAYCGELLPGGSKVYNGSFRQIPDRENILELTDIESRISTIVKIRIQLPKLFYNAKYPSDIIFYINPDINQVQVAYRVFSPEKQDFIKVDSEGKPFELKK